MEIHRDRKSVSPYLLPPTFLFVACLPPSLSFAMLSPFLSSVPFASFFFFPSFASATAFGKLTGSRSRAAYWIISGACRRRESGRPTESLLSGVSIDLPRARTSTGARSRRTSERSSGSAPRRDRVAPHRTAAIAISLEDTPRAHTRAFVDDEGRQRERRDAQHTV